MVKRVILVKYGEIFLRKGNRLLYERQLMETLRRRADDPCISVKREQGRLLLEDSRGDIDVKAVLPKIRYVLGVTAFCAGIKTDANEITDLKMLGLDLMRKIRPALDFSFKIITKRGDKRYPLTSQAISSEVGRYLLDNAPGLRVDIRNPEGVLWIEIRGHTYLYTESVPGLGGLPYASSGKGILLLSGGIDSPVAGYLMARRGVEIVSVYFHAPPYTSERVTNKVTDLVRRLSCYTGPARLWVVPFTEIQLFLRDHVKPAKLTVFIKRAMLAAASRLAVREQAHCLITGDSVGQVASQTIHSLEAVHSAASMPVIRPLAALDKQQIIDIAVTIGTYAVSIQPFEDCCTLFTAEHPECRPKASAIEGIEARLDALPSLVEKAAADAALFEIN